LIARLCFNKRKVQWNLHAKVKIKVKLSLYWIKHHPHEDKWESRSITLNLGTRQMSVVSFTLQSFHLWEEVCHTHWTCGSTDPRVGLGCCREGKILSPCQDWKPQLSSLFS
jgi:hypothetical protein